MTYRDNRFPEEIVKWRMLKRWGIHPGEHIAMFWRIPSSRKNGLRKILNNLLWWPTKRLSFDASNVNEETLSNWLSRINNLKPPLIWGYVGAVHEFAFFLKKNGSKLAYKPKCVWVTAAPLGDDLALTLEENLTKNILNQYACSEIHWVAANIPGTQQLIIEEDFRHVDIVNSENENCETNEHGDILITDLHNYAFPLIKYRVGDRSCFVEPEDERFPGFRRMAPVKGRVTDYIFTRSGIKITGEFLTTIFDDYTDYVSQFNIHQKDSDIVEIKIVPKNSFDKKALNKVKSELEKMAGGELEFKFDFVKEIPSDRGKVRYIKNDLLKSS